MWNPRFELLFIITDGGRSRWVHAKQTREVYFATYDDEERALILHECWEQHVKEGTSNFYSNRKHSTEACGNFPSSTIKGGKNADCSA